MSGGSLRPSPDVVAQELEGEIVLVHLRTNRIYSLNRTGARAWELLGEGWDRAELMAQLVGEFDVGRQELESEVDSLFARLAAEGLASWDEP